MDSDPGVNPLQENEIVFRRIASAFFDNGGVQMVAFKPHQTQDADGLSLSRECCTAVGAAATGRLGKAFYVAEATVVEVERIDGLTVRADRDDHALIPQMTSALRNSNDKADKLRCEEWARGLMLLFKKRQLHGPFPGQIP